MNIEPVWLNTLLGVILPFIIEWFKNVDWKREYKFLFAICISVVVGLLSAYFTNNFAFEIEKVLSTITYIFTITQVVYQFIVKGWEEG